MRAGTGSYLLRSSPLGHGATSCGPTGASRRVDHVPVLPPVAATGSDSEAQPRFSGSSWRCLSRADPHLSARLKLARHSPGRGTGSADVHGYGEGREECTGRSGANGKTPLIVNRHYMPPSGPAQSPLRRAPPITCRRTRRTSKHQTSVPVCWHRFERPSAMPYAPQLTTLQKWRSWVKTGVPRLRATTAPGAPVATEDRPTPASRPRRPRPAPPGSRTDALPE